MVHEGYHDGKIIIANQIHIDTSIIVLRFLVVHAAQQNNNFIKDMLHNSVQSWPPIIEGARYMY